MTLMQILAQFEPKFDPVIAVLSAYHRLGQTPRRALISSNTEQRALTSLPEPTGMRWIDAAEDGGTSLPTSSHT